jgi:hypothetical protein
VATALFCVAGRRPLHLARDATGQASGLEQVPLAATLRAAARILDRDWHRLHWRLDQTKRYAQVMEPSLQFVFHISPLGSLWRREFSGRFVQIIVLTPTRCLLKVNEL